MALRNWIAQDMDIATATAANPATPYLARKNQAVAGVAELAVADTQNSKGEPTTSKTAITGPAICEGCSRLEVIYVAGTPLAGCVREMGSGEWRREWHRLPANLKVCKNRITKAPDAKSKIPSHGGDLSKTGTEEHVRQQFNCQAFEYNGVIMSTHEAFCRQWQGPYCNGCILVQWLDIPQIQ